MLPLHLIGLNHRTAPLALRECFAFVPERQDAHLTALRTDAEEAVFLCTCNRSEWLFLADDEAAERVARHICAEAALPRDQFHEHFYRYRDDEALAHVFRVAAGLDSMIPGETQVLGQLKSAFALAFDGGHAGKGLLQVYQRLLNAAKAVRTQTALGQGAVSVGSLAVQFARRQFPDFAPVHVLLIGAGEMGKLVGDHFRATEARDLRVVNRNEGRGSLLARRLGGRQLYELEQLSEALRWADVVVSSTASRDYVVTAEGLRNCLPHRDGRPLCLIDVAVPRDIDPHVTNLPGVTLCNIDDMDRLVKEGCDRRREEVAEAEAIIARKVAETRLSTEDTLGPTAQALRERGQHIARSEVEKLLKQHRDWSEDERAAVAQCAERVANKLLHAPLTALRQQVLHGEASEQARTVRQFREIFGLED